MECGRSVGARMELSHQNMCVIYWKKADELFFYFFFFNDTATTEIYTLSLTRRSSDLQFVEAYIEQQGFSYTHLRPEAFMQNITGPGYRWQIGRAHV